MKNIFTKKINTNFIKIVAGAFKKLPAFVVYSFTIKKQTTPSTVETNNVDNFDTLVTGCNYTNTNIASDHIANDPATVGSFFIEPVEACHPELVEGSFLKDFFKRIIFNKRHTFKKMRVVHLNIQNSNNLPFNTHAMRNATLINLPKSSGDNKHSFMKTFLRKSGIFAIALLVANLFFLQNIFSQTTYTWTGGGGTNWTTTTSWTHTGGTGTTYPGTQATDIVVIPTTTNQPTLSNTLATNIASLTFTGTTVETLTITGATLNVTGAVTLNSQAGSNSAATITGTGTLSCGSVQVGTNVNNTNFATYVATMTSTISTLNITGTGNLTLSSYEGSSTFRLNNATFNLTSGTLTINGQIVTTNEYTGNVSTFTLGNTSPVLNLGGATPFNITGTGTSTITLNGTGATVNYDGTVAQTINNNTYNFNNLYVNNTSASGATLAAAITATNVAGNITVGNINTGSLLNTNNLAVAKGTGDQITVNAGSTLNAGTSVFSWSGTGGVITINGLFQTANTVGFSGATTTAIASTNNPTITLASTSTIQYNAAAAQTVTTRTYNGNLILSGSGNKTIESGTIVDANLSISSPALALLTNGGISNVNSLTLGGILQAAGSWGSTGSAATNKNNTYFVAANTGIIDAATGACPTITAALSVTGSNPICNGSSTTLAVTISGGVSPYKVVYSGGTINNYVSGTNITISPSTNTGYSLTSVTDANGCAATVSGTPSITVNPTSVGGAATATATSLCSGSNTSITVTGYTGTIQWQQSADGSTGWTTVSGGSGATTATYTTPNLIAATYYRAIVTSGVCAAAYSSVASVTLNTAPSISGNLAVSPSFACDGTNSTTFTVSASGSGLTYVWQRGIGGVYTTITGATTPNDGATYSNFNTATLTVANAPLSMNGYTYQCVVSGTCSPAATSNAATFHVLAIPMVTSIVGNGTLCLNTPTNYTATHSGGTGVWSIVNGTGAATIATNGDGSATVSATATGTVTITYTITGFCGTASQSLPVTVDPDASIASVTGTTSPICIGTTTPFTANGVVLSTNGTGAWSSDNTAVATVDASGNVTAVSAGTANIIYTITGGCNGTPSAQQAITIDPNASIASVTGTTSPICIGTTTPFTANGVVLSTNGTGAWSSDNTAVATVDASGNVTAVSAGTANIIYTITGGCNGTPSAQQAITIDPDASIASVTGTTSPICIGTTTPFTANGVVLSTNGTGAWSSDNTAVATVDASGNVTAVSAGTANIIYTITGGCNGTPSAQQAITVDPDASIASVTGTTSPICIGTTTPFTANGVVLSTNGTGAWSSDNTAVATVDASGNVTAVSAGTANIIYTITGGCNGTPSAQQAITVDPNASIASVTGTTNPICIGTTTPFTANGVVLSTNGTGAWSSDNTAVATVDASGNVTAVSAGTANIIYTITGGCNGTPSAQQAITIDPNASIASVTGTTSPICIGTTTPFTANGVVLSTNGTGAWSSDNTAVATVDASGNVTAVSAGTANIIYTITGGCNGTPSAQQAITIDPNASIASVTGTTSPICIGTTTPFTANGVVLSTNGTGAWSSDNTAVATVDASGNVTAVSAGTANIIYTITGGCNGTPSAQQAITIDPDASIASVTGTTSPICIGTTTPFTANGVVLSTNGTGAWSSDNTAVATVDASGNVTAVSAGTANIIYTITGGCNGTPSAQQAITVDPDASIASVTGTTSPICIGTTTPFTANGVVLSTNGTGAWSSDNTAVATVDASGNVTAVSAGTANIIYTITGGCNGTPSAQQAITVDPNASIASVTGTTNPICIGTTTPFTANGVVLSTNGTGAWSSDNTAVATVDASGNVTAVSAGTANIIYTITGGCNGTPSAQQAITVDPNASITSVSGGQTPICIGNETTVTANGLVLGSNGTGTWSSDNTSVAIVDGSGNVTAIGPGTANITYIITGGCNGTPSASESITVNDNSTISLSSATGTDGQTVCINNAINNIVYTVGGGATGATVAGLPDGVAGNYDPGTGLFTIIGTPTVSGTFNYTVTTVGPCDDPYVTGTITVNANSSIDLYSANETAAQTVCINNAITPIVYSIDNGGTGGVVTGLPNGVTGSYSGGVFTITGTPSQPGTFTYTVTTTGPCQQVSLGGTIIVNDNSTITLSAAGTDGQTVCINNAINNINYNIGGDATGASITAGSLPNGVTGSFNGSLFTITGTPTQSGNFSYTVTTSGPCNNVSLSGTITVNANSTINLSSAIGTDGQTVCINNAITAITYAVGGGGTSASITAGSLPTGVTGSFSGGVFTITGTPTQSGSFPYTITTAGPCTNVSLSGTITVNADATISLSSGPATQTVCINTGIIPVAYTIGGSANNASITAGSLPSGVTGSFNGGVFTISGTPTQSGIFNFTLTTAGPCVNQSLSGTITVYPSPVVNAISNASYCNNSAGAAISFSTSTPGIATYTWTSTADVGFGTNGTGNILAFTATNNSNSVVTATVTVMATINGCPGAPTTFNITVNPSPVVNPVSNLNYCNNGAGAGISFSSPITGGTVNYTWTSSVNAGFGLNGNGNIGSFTAMNNSFAPLVATVTVTPSLNGCTGTPISFTVTVNPNANSGTISGSSTLCTGTSAQLSTNGNAGGTWTTSTPSIATVDPVSGLVTAGMTTGSATIFYTVNNICGSSSSSYTVSVNPTAAAGTISGASAVCAGSSILLSTNGNSGGNWFSSNTSAATVNPSGFVTGVSAGTTTIYYYVVNSCGTSISAPYTVTVSAGGNPGTIIGSSSICAGSATLLLTTGTTGGTWGSTNTAVAIIDGASGFVIAQSAGTTTITYTVASNSCSSGSQVAYFTLTVNPAGNAGTITGNSNICVGTSSSLITTGSSGGTWLSGNTLVATVDPVSGLVTGVAPGAVLITYHVSNSCGTANATFPINVSPGAVAGTISGSSSVCVGSAISLTSNGNPGGSWTSSNPAAAQVDANGVVLGIGAGNTTITYTVTSSCSSSSTSTTISVNASPIAGSVSGSATICAGLSAIFTTTGNSGGTWTSSNTAAATVNGASGVVTAVAAGNSTITYTVTGVCGTMSASAPVTVAPVLNAGTISGGSSVCSGGASLDLSASGNNGGSWASSNTSVATVDGSGVVTSIAAGTTTITYTVSNGCGTSNATQLITVNPLVNAGTVTGAAMLCSGLSTSFTTTGTGGTWSSSNTAVATVNTASGLVTGVGAGNATITYTVTSGCGNASASAAITINSLADAGTITGSNAVCVMSTINLSSNITGGTWGTNSMAIATVSTSGVVTGAAAGSTTITYTVTTTCGTNVASFPITVNAAPNAGMIPGTTTSVCVGSSIFLSDVGGMTGGLWRSVNPAKASVDPSTGQVTGVSSGNTIIVYSVTNSCGTSTANLPITVNSLPNAGTISGLTSVCAGASINLSASGDAGGTWTSNAPGVASVDPNTGVVTGVAQGTTTIIYTVGSVAVCGTSAATYTVSVNPLAIAGTISGTTTVCTGLSTTLTSNGAIGGTWTSSNPAVASVNSTSGVVIGVAAGSAVINYTVTNICGSTTASATVTVNGAPDPGTISGATSVCVGSNLNLSDNVSGGTWSSSTHSVATVGPITGIVSGIAAGNTTITYTVTNSCGTTSTSYAITVNPVPVAATITGTTYLCTGSTTTLYANITGGSWNSSNTAAATVDPATGLVTGLSAGTTTISYTISSGCGSATSSVVVTIGNSPSGGTVSGASALCVGSTAIFISNGTGGGSWSSNNPAAATVDAVTGVVTGVAAGSATISYTVSSTCGSAVSSSNITISALPNAGTLSGSSAICAGSTATLTSNGASGGSWSSNNNLVAGVNSTTGVVTGVAAGSATITYTVTNTCGIATSTENITINPLPNSGVVSGAGTLCAGVTTAFTSTGNGGGSWSSSNTAVATVDAVTGAVTGVAAGSATISYTVTSATCGSSVSSANITINPSPDPGTISGLSAVCAGSTITLTSDGTINGTWSSGNTSVATVDNNGVVTAVAAGSTTITYSVTNGCGTAGATKVITVNPLANSGTVSGAATLCAGGATTTFTSNGLSGGTWSSDNTSVATVDAASGLVTGVSAGNANITYSVTTPCGTSTNSAPITVIILPNAGTVSGSLSLCAGSTTNYTSSGLTGGTWSSLTPSVATVDAVSGLVTGVSAGNATITYTFTNSCGTKSASQIITVNPLANAGTVSGASSVCIGAQATFISNGLSGGTWSSNSSSASVDPNTGVVTGNAAGNATITYTSNTSCGTTTASANITVVAIPFAGTVSGNTSVCVGATTPYASSGMSGGTWSSVTPSVATVDATSGIVTGVSAGNATIVYTFTNSCGSPSASQMITVNPLPNAGIVSGASAVCIGSQATFTTNGLSGGTWSSNSSAATVNATTGVVMGVAAGSATIIYTSATPCGTLTATANITVNPVLSAGTLSGSSTLCIGSTTPYTSSGSAGGTWSSVTPSVATVNATTGVVTGVSTGNATITYTVSSGCGTFSATKMIAVSPAANTGTISGPSSVCTGSSVNFTRSGGSGTGTWSSSNTAVATVNSSGRVTGVASGTAVISYSVTSSCGIGSTTSSITVNSSLSLTATNINASTDPTSCSASVTLGSNVTTTGSPTLQYAIGFYPFFYFPIPATNTFYRGTTPVVVIASNSCGSIARMFLVTVTDNTPPTISCKGDASRTANGSTGKYSVIGHEFDATATDGCGVASLVYSLSGSTVVGFNNNNTSLNNVKLNIGITTITWKATDVNGNVSTCSTNITVTGNPGHYFGREDESAPSLQVKVAPNPTSNYFTLKFLSDNPANINIVVVDVMGRTVEEVRDILPNSTLQIGGSYHPGVYIVQAVQGSNAVALKLIKEGN